MLQNTQQDLKQFKNETKHDKVHNKSLLRDLRKIESGR
ncbi:hypothetical protein F9789_1415 [Staphylococcus arlettae]|nr:hypothetical protein [Staphylococcus arlettae]